MGVLKTDGGTTLFSKRMFQGASRLLFALVAEPKFDSGAAGDAPLADGGVDDDGVGMCLLTPDEGVTAELVIAGGDDIWYQRQSSFGLIFAE